jgi:hypothetical protein
MKTLAQIEEAIARKENLVGLLLNEIRELRLKLTKISDQEEKIPEDKKIGLDCPFDIN